MSYLDRPTPPRGAPWAHTSVGCGDPHGPQALVRPAGRRADACRGRRPRRGVLAHRRLPRRRPVRGVARPRPRDGGALRHRARPPRGAAAAWSAPSRCARDTLAVSGRVDRIDERRVEPETDGDGRPDEATGRSGRRRRDRARRRRLQDRPLGPGHRRGARLARASRSTRWAPSARCAAGAAPSSSTTCRAPASSGGSTPRSPSPGTCAAPRRSAPRQRRPRPSGRDGLADRPDDWAETFPPRPGLDVRVVRLRPALPRGARGRADQAALGGSAGRTGLAARRARTRRSCPRSARPIPTGRRGWPPGAARGRTPAAARPRRARDASTGGSVAPSCTSTRRPGPDGRGAQHQGRLGVPDRVGHELADQQHGHVVAVGGPVRRSGPRDSRAGAVARRRPAPGRRSAPHAAPRRALQSPPPYPSRARLRRRLRLDPELAEHGRRGFRGLGRRASARQGARRSAERPAVRPCRPGPPVARRRPTRRTSRARAGRASASSSVRSGAVVSWRANVASPLGSLATNRLRRNSARFGVVGQVQALGGVVGHLGVPDLLDRERLEHRREDVRELRGLTAHAGGSRGQQGEGRHRGRVGEDRLSSHEPTEGVADQVDRADAGPPR